MLHCMGVPVLPAVEIDAVLTFVFAPLADMTLLAGAWATERCGARDGAFAVGPVAGMGEACWKSCPDCGSAETKTDFEMPDRAQWPAAQTARATTATASLLMETEK